MLRELIFDTETTGLNEKSGDRIVELALLEVIDMQLTGRRFHYYLNPAGKKSNPFALRVHGLDSEFLEDKPFFHEIVDDLLEFIGNTICNLVKQ